MTRTADIRKLAKRQRWLIWLILLSFVPHLLFYLRLGQYGDIAAIVGILLGISIYLLQVIGIVLLLSAQGNHCLMIFICGVLMLVPCGNLLLLLLVNMSVTRTLRRAGLRVGFMGVDPDSVERTLDPSLCKQCGYDLTGNISGRCPECGKEIDRSMAPA